MPFPDGTNQASGHIADVALTLPALQDSNPSLNSGGLLAIPLALLARFGDFQRLGSGAMGVVYRAKDLQLGRDIAVKFLHEADPETNRTLLREARAQALLDHNHACKIYDVGMADDRPYIVMQYVAGEPLDRASQRMTLEQKVRAVEQVTSALHEAHRLGIVHRDVKPSNIMVEECADGALKPFIMDFGIAREIGKSTQTANAFAGTPAYMAPEQAAGDVTILDRRTDVYALGATLYDLLAGRPPFYDPNLVMVVQKLLTEEPTPLRKLRPGIPEDLEAIVMKCLEKEQSQRYDSAKALSEDLQRFLDGTSVLARKASFTYAFAKYVRKHKVRMSIGIVLTILIAIFGSMWIHERQTLAERAAISRALAEDVKEMELFMARTYALPLHDIERERGIVRQQLSDINVRMSNLGPVGEGPGHYALARGYLALHEPDSALWHLRRAEKAGYTPPEHSYAMGLALVELYHKALEETKRIQDEHRRELRIAAIDNEFKIPALTYLRSALGARLSSPAYVEGLMALHEGRNDVAIEKAREAFAHSPWLHEAKKLEGDAFFAEGKRYQRDASFDYDKLMQQLEPAAAAYAAAADIARSDPAVHEAACDLWTQVILASDARPNQLRPSFDKAKDACEKALTADARSSSAHMKMAFAHHAYAWRALNGPATKDLEKSIREAIERAEQAAAIPDSDAMAHYLVGAAYRTEIVHRLNHGLDARDSIDRAIAAHEKAIRLDPGFLWPYNEVCASYAERARSELWRGIDPSSSVDLAVKRCDQAIAQDPSFTYPALAKALAYFRQAQYLIEKGRSPHVMVANAIDTALAVKTRNTLDAASSMAWASWLEASYECDAGENPQASLEKAEALLNERERIAPSSANDELRGLIAMTRALWLVRQENDPIAAITQARSFFHKSLQTSPWDVDYRLENTHTEMVALRWAIMKGNADSAQFDVAFAALASILDKELANPHVYQSLAELHEMRAEWLLARKQDAGDDLKKGLEMADKALAIDMRMAKALATKGMLHLLRARTPDLDTNAGMQSAREAKTMLQAAIRENPLLAREKQTALSEAERLVGRTEGK